MQTESPISAEIVFTSLNLGKYVVHSNLDIAKKSVRPFLFTISKVLCLVNPENGSWVLFTISRNSLYRGSLYQGLSVRIFFAYTIAMTW